ncbi:hypothetical protein DMENIID0001_038230 [Sergentomyia squamirostris]
MEYTPPQLTKSQKQRRRRLAARDRLVAQAIAAYLGHSDIPISLQQMSSRDLQQFQHPAPACQEREVRRASRPSRQVRSPLISENLRRQPVCRRRERDIVPFGLQELVNRVAGAQRSSVPVTERARSRNTRRRNEFITERRDDYRRANVTVESSDRPESPDRGRHVATRSIPPLSPRNRQRCRCRRRR